MLEKLLKEAPLTPLSHLEKAFDEFNGSTVAVSEGISVKKAPISPYIRLPSLVPWCRQCNRYGHIDYTTILCARCNANHQTSSCPITIMGMCVYCSAIGVHFSQLCPQRKLILFCDRCGKSDHEAESCPVLISRKLMKRPKELSKIVCNQCHEKGHFGRKCPEEQCPNCKDHGHGFKDCYVRISRILMKAMPKCGGCNISGHTYRDCPQRSCETCGESTHRRYECRARVRYISDSI
jgi:hypothetical protein